MRSFSALLLILVLGGCSGPLLFLPGGQLRGAEARLELTAIPADAEVLQLETNPDDPYSVNVGFRRINGNVYIDPTPERRWYQHMASDPRVRIRFEGEDVVHPAAAEVVKDAAMLRQFEDDRIVIRLVPRG